MARLLKYSQSSDLKKFFSIFLIQAYLNKSYFIKLKNRFKRLKKFTIFEFSEKDYKQFEKK
ncbi:hypothetical protein BpHYR1_030814 [Brachionus plicatilis]|uniref:Uncharacterized protein n=1 Tax=Brachionus plicatilis TaxID=10195 RepID=A0A3M7PBD9_BRAPC|nr:hypothetical protein BpHYR1_030814 [Brachionus plicatilis]